MKIPIVSPRNTDHVWKFFRAGGFDQVRLDAGADLANIDRLDQKLWVALACPTSGLEFDAKTLEVIDTDKDGRIRPPEIIAATTWACSRLKNPDDLLQGSPSLRLDAINDATPEGSVILAAARQILAGLGKKDAGALTLEDTGDSARIFAQSQFNGDGILPADATDDAGVKAVIADIIAIFGAQTDRSGKPGVSQPTVDRFFAAAAAYAEWWAHAEADREILPLGAATPAAAAAVSAVKAKVDDYFARCRLAEFDPRAINALNREEKEYLALAAKELTIAHAEIAALPLARVEAFKPLPLTTGINPAWAEAMARLKEDAVAPLLGARDAITAAEWAALSAGISRYEAWAASKTGAEVEHLGLDRVREILAGSSREDLAALIARDKELEAPFEAIAAVDKLIRLNRDISRLLNNFVSFRDFYGRKSKAIFQAGTLYLDQRSCDLCLAVDDNARHAAMAGMAGAYLAYCECIRKGTGEKRQVVAAFTGGDSDNLMVGRNGIFYDRQGRDWDATITRIVDNPISIRQAFFAPYKKLVRLIEEQVGKRAAAASATTDAHLSSTAKGVAGVDQIKPAELPKPKIDTGTLAAIGLVLTTLLGALSGIFGHILGLVWWKIPLAFLAIALAISSPSVMMAWLKLRKRNLGPILDANGWAVNAKARLNVPFGGSLTQVASLPAGSERDLTDPFAEKRSPWPAIILLVVILVAACVVLFKSGKIHEWSGGWFGTPAVTQEEEGTGAAK